MNSDYQRSPFFRACSLFSYFFRSHCRTKEWRTIGAPPLSGPRCANALACVRGTLIRTRASCIKETPKWVNTDNYVLHASAHTNKFHLIPLTANPASFFIPPHARTALLSHSTMHTIAANSVAIEKYIRIIINTFQRMCVHIFIEIPFLLIGAIDEILDWLICLINEMRKNEICFKCVFCIYVE